MHARTTVFGVQRTIEEHYQLAKRFGDFAPSSWRQAKGKRPTHFVVGGVSFPPTLLTSFYLLLWAKYLGEHPELVRYAASFDRFNDSFAKRGNNNQAEAIRLYVHEGPRAIFDREDVKEFRRRLKLSQGGEDDLDKG